MSEQTSQPASGEETAVDNVAAKATTCRADWAWRLVPLMLFVLAMGAKWETFSLPGYWDELLVYIKSSLWLAENGLYRALPGLHSNQICYGHPPFIFVTLGTIYKLFGYSHAATHLFSAFFGFVGIYATYKLGSLLADRRTGLIASLLLFFSPIYYANAGVVSAEIFVASLAVSTVYFLLTRNKAGYLAAGVCLALSKASSLAVFVAILAYLVLFTRKRPRLWRRVAFYALPLAAIVAFMAVQRLITGHAVDNPDLQQSIFAEGLKLSWGVSQFAHIGRLIFVEQWRFVTSAFLFLYCVIHYRRAATPVNALFLFIVAGFFGAHMFIYFLPRYILAVFPFYFIVCAQAMLALERNRAATSILAAVLCGLSLMTSYVRSADGRYGLEITMAYADYVRANTDLVAYLGEKYPDNTISMCLSNYTLMDPDLHYTSRKFHVSGPGADVAVTPENLVDPHWGCKREIEGEGYLFDAIFSHGVANFRVYVRPGMHKFE